MQLSPVDQETEQDSEGSLLNKGSGTVSLCGGPANQRHSAFHTMRIPKRSNSEGRNAVWSTQFQRLQIHVQLTSQTWACSEQSKVAHLIVASKQDQREAETRLASKPCVP